MTLPDPPDVLILGGGAAGCVLAARLSEDPARRVALVEAGPDAAPTPARRAAYPGRAYFDPATLWPGPGVRLGGVRRNAGRAPAGYAQARVLGGGTAINGLGANRGAPSDYDGWGAMGAAGWSWAAVAPAFAALERDLDMAGPGHGRDGPIPVRRPDLARASGFARAAAAQAARAGAVWRADQNGAWRDGLYPITLTLDETWRRVDAARAWLTPAVRRRPNLAILTGVEALRVVIEGGRAVGAALRLPDGREATLRAGAVVVAAGALRSPVLLMRGGVGDGAALQAAGIAVAAHRPGVGANLQEHPAAGVAAWLPRGARAAADAHHIPIVQRFSSGLDGAPAGDMHLALMTRAAWHPVGRRVGMAYVWVNRAHSQGHVRLARDGFDVDFRLLSDDRDRTRLADGFRRAAALMTATAAAGACGPPFAAQPAARARRFAAPSAMAWAATAAAALALDAAGRRAPALLARLAGDAPPLAALLADPDRLDAFLDDAVTGVWHACGTCRMGDPDDPRAVTDGAGRVIGVAGLRVCDASLFPTVPCANLALPVMMTALRVADAIIAEGAC